jgi:transcriptional regulator with XRE-family HTH domain
MMLQKLGKTIRDFRMRNHLSQSELADLINLPAQSKISSWERNCRIPDVFEAQRLAQVFGVTIDDLLAYG